MLNSHEEFLQRLRYQIRLIQLLDAAESAGLVPLPILRLHTFAYLANVLAPVWDIAPLDGKLLKRKGGPFYPVLQSYLDRLVGQGIVEISGLGYVLENDRWRLSGAYRLQRSFAGPILNVLAKYDEEVRKLVFVQELALALSALDDSELDRAMGEDATYSDGVTATESVIDFAEWKLVNYSANATQYFRVLTQQSGFTTPGELLNLYVQHLHRRLHYGS